MSYIGKLPIKRAIALLTYAQEQEETEIIFRYYIAQLPGMDKNSFMTFSQYLSKYKPVKVALDNRPTDKLMEEISNMKFD